MTDAEVIDAEVVTPGAELAPVPSSNLFHSDDPATVLAKATATANALSGVIAEKNMAVQIQGKAHITVEGWLTLSAMLGVTPFCEWTRKLENGWEARVQVRTLDGRVIGAAEAECLTTENRWSSADDYAVRSMAQTRATSKALASVLRFVVTLAGFSGTPAEEMDGVKRSGGGGGSNDRPASQKQQQWVVGGGGRPSLFDQASLGDGQRKALVRWLSGGDTLTSSAASRFIEAMKDAPERGAQSLLEALENAAADGDGDAKAGAAHLTSGAPVDTSDFEDVPKPTGAADEEPPF